MSTNTYSDAIDTRIVFRIYAVVAWLSGVFLIGWGPLYFPLELAGFPHSGGFVVRIVGATLVAVDCFAHTFACVDDPAVRRRAMGMWAVGHAQVLMMVVVQVFGELGSPGPGARAALAALLTVTILLHYFWLSAGPDGGPDGVGAVFLQAENSITGLCEGTSENGRPSEFEIEGLPRPLPERQARRWMVDSFHRWSPRCSLRRIARRISSKERGWSGLLSSSIQSTGF